MMTSLASKGLGFVMLINTPPKKTGTKELKVHIPVKYHLQLHQMKVLEGRQIHAVIEEALDHWFTSVNAAAAKTE